MDEIDMNILVPLLVHYQSETSLELSFTVNGGLGYSKVRLDTW